MYSIACLYLCIFFIEDSVVLHNRCESPLLYGFFVEWTHNKIKTNVFFDKATQDRAHVSNQSQERAKKQACRWS